MQQFAAAEIGQRIKEARLAAGLTQEEVAEMASFSKRSLQDYETGVTVPYKHMRELSRLLNRPTEWFLYGDEYAGWELNRGEVEQALLRFVALAERLESVARRLEDV